MFTCLKWKNKYQVSTKKTIRFSSFKSRVQISTLKNKILVAIYNSMTMEWKIAEGKKCKDLCLSTYTTWQEINRLPHSIALLSSTASCSLSSQCLQKFIKHKILVFGHENLVKISERRTGNYHLLAQQVWVSLQRLRCN